MKHNILSRIVAYLLFMALSCGISSCESNNGDIGDLYATWNVGRVTIDGTDDPDYDGNVSWAFQSNILWMVAVLDHEQTDNCYATWALQDDGKVMTIDLSHGYLAELSSLPWGTVVHMSVVTHTNDSLTLSYINKAGETVVYYLKKLV